MISDWNIYKDKGNEEYKKKNFEAAIRLYNEGLSI